ncbi:MAG: ABC transporter ATP-binding protein [Anaerovoracaceae bacterium]
MSDYVYEVKNLVKVYHQQMGMSKGEDVYALDGTSFLVDRGEFVCIMGRSGCGKTTLLNILGLLDRDYDGEMLFNGEIAKRFHSSMRTELRRRRIGFIFQDYELLPDFTIRENISLPMVFDNLSPEQISERISILAGNLMIEQLLDLYPYELSGGQKQRAAICRALSNKPDVILADEPTGNLDSKSGETVIEMLAEMNKEYGQTIVMVTHDPKMASYAGRILFLKDGKIIQTLKKGETQKDFYQKIVEHLTAL